MGADEAALLQFVADGNVPRRNQVVEWLLRRAWLSEERDGDGRGDEGIRRLKAVLSELKGPPAELTKLLGEGLDAVHRARWDMVFMLYETTPEPTWTEFQRVYAHVLGPTAAAAVVLPLSLIHI